MIRLVILFLVVHGCAQLTAQELKFEGNRITKSDWLKSVLVGKKTTPEQQEDVKQLSNTGLFQAIDRTYGDSEVTYSLVEKKYLVPIFYAGLGNSHSPIITVGLAHYNLFGRAVQMTALYTYFDRSSAEFFIDAPRLFNGRHGPYLYAKHKNTLEPVFFENQSYQYAYGQRSAELGWYYYLTSSLRVKLGLERFMEIYDARDEIPDQLPLHFEPKKWTVKTEVRYNDVVYDYHRFDGWDIAVGASNTSNSADFAMSESFSKYTIDTRYYKFMGKDNRLNIAGRVFGGLSKFDSTPFAAFVKDDLVNVRGVGERVARGASEVTINAELRYDVLTSNKIFAQAVFFSDYSNILPSDFFKLDDAVYSDYNDIRIGLGLRLGTYYFYNSALRFDASFDPERGRFEGVIIGVGQFF